MASASGVLNRRVHTGPVAAGTEIAPYDPERRCILFALTGAGLVWPDAAELIAGFGISFSLANFASLTTLEHGVLVHGPWFGSSASSIAVLEWIGGDSQVSLASRLAAQRVIDQMARCP